MIQAKCVQKFRNTMGRIYGYRLIDINGNSQDVTPDDLKTAIRNRQIQVVNLSLTSDNRLIDKQPEKQLQNTKIMPPKVENPINKKEDFIEKIETLLNHLIKTIGEGELQIEPSENSDLWLLGTLYGLWYDCNDTMYGATFGIDLEANEFFIEMQEDCMGDVEFGYSDTLNKPIVCDKNLDIIKDVLNRFYKEFKRWTDKKEAEQED